MPRRETLSDSEVSQILGGCQLPFVRFTRWNDKRHKPKRNLFEEIRSQKLCGSALHVWSVIHVEQTPGYHPTPNLHHTTTAQLGACNLWPMSKVSFLGAEVLTTKLCRVRRLATTHSYICEPPQKRFSPSHNQLRFGWGWNIGSIRRSPCKSIETIASNPWAKKTRDLSNNKHN